MDLTQLNLSIITKHGKQTCFASHILWRAYYKAHKPILTYILLAIVIFKKTSDWYKLNLLGPLGKIFNFSLDCMQNIINWLSVTISHVRIILYITRSLKMLLIVENRHTILALKELWKDVINWLSWTHLTRVNISSRIWKKSMCC